MKTSRGGFTLLELLLAIAILLLLLGITLQVVSATHLTVTSETKRIDATSQARSVLNMMTYDLANLLRRKDVPYYFHRQNGNDEFFFFAETPGNASTNPDQDSTLSLVGYRIDPAGGLSRYSRKITWDGAMNSGGMPFGSSIDDLRAAVSTLDDKDFQSVSEQTFRLEIGFLLKNGQVSDTTQISGTNAADDNDGLKDVSGVIISIAALDSISKKIAPDLQPAVAVLSDAGANFKIENWNGIVEGSGFAQSTHLPPAAASNIRVFQRVIPLR